MSLVVTVRVPDAEQVGLDVSRDGSTYYLALGAAAVAFLNEEHVDHLAAEIERVRGER